LLDCSLATIDRKVARGEIEVVYLDSHPRFRLTELTRLQLLKQQTALRADYIPQMNYNRHLARLYPTILRRESPQVYCEELIRAYCVVHWPLPHEKPDEQADSLLQWILAMLHIGHSHPSA